MGSRIPKQKQNKGHCCDQRVWELDFREAIFWHGLCSRLDPGIADKAAVGHTLEKKLSSQRFEGTGFFLDVGRQCPGWGALQQEIVQVTCGMDALGLGEEPEEGQALLSPLRVQRRAWMVVPQTARTSLLQKNPSVGVMGKRAYGDRHLVYRLMQEILLVWRKQWQVL